MELEEYISVGMNSFFPKKIGLTCSYANAVATVYIFHLAMRRIYNRDGDIPGFWEVRTLLIEDFSSHGAKT